jgi:hypothetical protein
MRKVYFVLTVICVCISASNAFAITGLTIDVTGPGGLGVKEVQPGLVTGEIWATVTGENSDPLDDGLLLATGGLQLTGDGSFLPFDPEVNYAAPFNLSSYHVYLSDDGKTLGHEGLTSYTDTGVLFFQGLHMANGGRYKLGTFEADLQAGDSVQFLLSGRSHIMYVFKADAVSYTGITGRDLIYLGTPLVAVPEPSTIMLVVMGAMVSVAWIWRRNRRTK